MIIKSCNVALKNTKMFNSEEYINNEEEVMEFHRSSSR
jgi:hypothetical protein